MWKIRGWTLAMSGHRTAIPLLTLTLPRHGITVTNSLPFSVQRTNWVSCRISGES